MTRRKKLIHFTFKETLHVDSLIRTIKQREPLCKTTAADNQMKQRNKGTLYAAGARDVSSCFVNQDLAHQDQRPLRHWRFLFLFFVFRLRVRQRNDGSRPWFNVSRGRLIGGTDLICFLLSGTFWPDCLGEVFPPLISYHHRNTLVFSLFAELLGKRWINRLSLSEFLSFMLKHPTD